MSFSLIPESEELDYPGRMITSEGKIPVNLRCLGLPAVFMRESIRKSDEDTNEILHLSMRNAGDVLPPQTL